MTIPLNSVDLILEPEEFDPLTEIKNLRQNLIRRLKSLQPEKTIETDFNFVDIHSEPSCCNPSCNSCYNEETTATQPIVLIQQISHTRQLLSQLQIKPEKIAVEEVVKETPAKQPKIQPTKQVKEHLTKTVFVNKVFDSFLPALNVLKIINMILTWIGFLGILAGLLLSLRFMDQNGYFGLPLIVAGAMIIAIGFLGQIDPVSFNHQKNIC